MRKRLSPGMILGVFAVVLACTGSATAGSLITSGKIKDGTIRGRDIRKGTITTDRLSSGIRRNLLKAGTTGPKGDKGDKGDTGPAGPTLQGSAPQKGEKGDPGPAGTLLGFETDNGTQWALSVLPLALKNPGSGYADSGVVVDLGPASDFTGITSSGNGALAHNVWISDGDQAFAPGMHNLSTPANFTYGLGQDDGTFFMSTGPDAGHALTPAQIATKYAGYEAYAWVGVVRASGDAPTTGRVDSVNGTHVGADLTIDGTTTRAASSS
jgi:hypothetical protein